MASPSSVLKFPIAKLPRELKQRRRRGRGRRLEKKRICILPAKFAIVRFTNGFKNLLRLNMQLRHSFQMEIRKISRRRPRSEVGHFTLLFCRGRQRNVQRFITHVHSYCSAH